MGGREPGTLRSPTPDNKQSLVPAALIPTDCQAQALGAGVQKWEAECGGVADLH